MSTSNSKKVFVNGEAANNNFNSVEAVESIYTDESIDIIDVVDLEQAAATNTPAANECVNIAEAGIYSLNSARRAKIERSLERRAHKAQLTDRRQSIRLDANGEQQQDRRAENRLANIESLRQAHTPPNN